MRRRSPSPYKKKSIPFALREQVWIQYVGRKFESKCLVSWCNNTITAFDFQAGHNVPESRGGKTDISNLQPICSRCNISMGNTYTIDQWNKIYSKPNGTANGNGTNTNGIKPVSEVTPNKRWWYCLCPCLLPFVSCHF